MLGQEERSLGADFEGNSVRISTAVAGVARYALMWVLCVLLAFFLTLFSLFNQYFVCFLQCVPVSGHQERPSGADFSGTTVRIAIALAAVARYT